LSEALVEINKTDITILLVEQDVITAFDLADKAFVIESGRVTTSGPANDLADDPRIRQVYMGIQCPILRDRNGIFMVHTSGSMH
jgi:branched-chain amino acid transport system ATP-binding protein